MTHLDVEGCDAESGLNWAQRLDGEVWEMVKELRGGQWVPSRSKTVRRDRRVPRDAAG